MAWCKTVVTPLLMHWSYHSVALSHRYVNGVMQQGCNSIANALELHLRCNSRALAMDLCLFFIKPSLCNVFFFYLLVQTLHRHRKHALFSNISGHSMLRTKCQKQSLLTMTLPTSLGQGHSQGQGPFNEAYIPGSSISFAHCILTTHVAKEPVDRYVHRGETEHHPWCISWRIQSAYKSAQDINNNSAIYWSPCK